MTFPYRNDDRKHAWTQSKVRKGTIPREINLGCRQEKIKEGCFNYNSQFTGDKIKVFEVFDKAGIRHPRLLTKEQIQAGDNIPDKFLGRKNKSSRGRGITLYDRSTWLKSMKAKFSRMEQHDFFVEFLECKSEHRIHVFQGQVVCELNKKIKAGNFIHTAEQGSPLEVGRIVHPRRDEMVDLSVKAVAAVGLDFGAVDIFVDINDNVYILEVNSDPGMPGVIGFLYAEKFRQVFNMPKPKDYFIDPMGKYVEIEESFFFRTPEEKKKAREARRYKAKIKKW